MRKTFVALVLALLVALAAAPQPAGATSAASSPCALVPNGLAQQISATEPWYCPINQQIYAQWSSELPLAAIGVTVAFSIAALITMMGIALRNDRIRNFGVGEFYEAVASTLIIMLFLYVCAVLFGILPGVFVGAINPFPVAFNLISTVTQQVQQVFAGYYNQYMLYAYVVSVVPRIQFTFGGLGISPSSQLLTAPYTIPLTIYYLDPLISLSALLTDGLTTLWGEYYLLVFFSVAAIPVFLVPGTVLRAVFPVRALGGMLMALGIAFYLVMPSLFALSYYLTYPGIQQSLSTAAAQATRFSTSPPPAASVASPSSPLVLQLQNVKSAMSQFFLLILFYPILIAAVTYAFVTQVANFIGGAARTTGRLRGFV